MKFLQNLSLHLLALFLLIAGLLLSQTEFIQIQGLKLHDAQRRLVTKVQPATDKIILITVDQQSLDLMERDQAIGWPWPREYYGLITAFAAQGGAKATFIDILFNNHSSYGVFTDEAFASALQEAGQVYLATGVTSKHQQQRQWMNLPVQGKVPEIIIKTGLVPPVEVIAAKAAGLGNVNSTPDADGTFRRVDPFFIVADKGLPILGLSAFAKDSEAVKFHPDGISYANKQLPLDRYGKLWVNFPQSADHYTRISAYDLIYSLMAMQAGEQPTVDPAVFDKAYVFIGYTAPGLFDMKPTPFSATAAGVEVHMALLHSWLADDFMQPMSRFTNGLLSVIFALLLYGIFLWVKNISQALWMNLLVLTGVVLLSLGFVRQGVIVDLPLLLLPGILLASGVGGRIFVRESREKEFRQRSLEKMVSPNVSKWLLDNPQERMHRTGELREISVFFSDLEGFTTLAEKLGPENTVTIINQYMDMMQSVILQYDGTIKQFVGDAVMAIWGAPLEQENQTVLAIKTALDSQKLLAEKYFVYGDDQQTRLRMRIGVDYGKCIVGNIGSSKRFEYAAVGDTVNRAARLEGLNKYYGTQVIVSESAWQASHGAFFGRELDRVLVKGKTHAVGIYEPMALSGEQTEKQQSLASAYLKGWQFYADGQWQQARDVLQPLAEIDQDSPSLVILERLSIIEKDPAMVGDNWNGVWKFTTK